jgi:hypothetical protein
MGKTIDSFFKKLPSTPLRKSPRKSVVSTPWNQYSLFAHALRSHTLACVRTFTTHTHATPNACTLVSHTMQRNVSRSHSLARVRALTTHTHATPDCMHNCTVVAHTTRHTPRIQTRTHVCSHSPHTQNLTVRTRELLDARLAFTHARACARILHAHTQHLTACTTAPWQLTLRDTRLAFTHARNT